MITADRNRIPARHVRSCPFNHVAKKTQRRFCRKNRFVLRLHFLENIGLNRAPQIRHHFRTETAFGRRYVHCHDDRRRTADRHRCRKIRRAELEAIVEPYDVFHRVDCDSALADFSENAVGIGIDPVEGWSIEGGAETFRALMRAQEMETLVRVLSQHQAGEQTSRFLL